MGRVCLQLLANFLALSERFGGTFCTEYSVCSPYVAFVPVTFIVS